MGNLTRAVAEWLGLTRSESPDGPAEGVTPPARSAGPVAPTSALTISMVYRAVQIIATAAKQLSIDVRRGGSLIAPPLIARKPDPDTHRSAFIEYTVVSLVLHGNAYWRLLRLDPNDPTSPVVALKPLNPAGVVIWDDPDGVRRYSYNDDRGRHHLFEAWQVSHIPLRRIPGTPYGLGPIQAANPELAGAIELRNYTSGWFGSSGVPSGTLSTDQHLNKEQAETYRDMWDAVPAGRTRITGGGLKYAPILINPRDAQFLESQQFTTTQIARLFGVPASLMLAVVEGSSRAYANVEQDWIGYVRFGLMDYLREMEEAFTEIMPRGQEVRFNPDGLLRTDTKTRYEAHEIALRAGWTDVAEVREIEGLPPRPDLTTRRVSSDTPAAPEA